MILIAGTDQMAFFASYLRHLLMLLDIRADLVATPSQEALGRLARIDENTLVVGLSAGRAAPLMTRTMKLARHRKATTAAITDATLSEVAQARPHPALLLVELPGVRALAHRAAVHRAGARLRRSTRATRPPTRTASRPSGSSRTLNHPQPGSDP